MGLIRFPSPKLALDFIKGPDKDADTDAMAVDALSNAEAALDEDAPPTDEAPAEAEEAKDA